MKFLYYLGRAKYKFIRVVAYLGIYNALMLTYMAGWHWWYLLLPFIGGAVYYFEVKFGIPGETEVSWKACKEWQEYKRDFYALRDYLYKK